MTEPSPLGYAFGETESDKMQFGFEVSPFLEYSSSISGDWSPTSNCSSVSDDSLSASMYGTESCPDVSNRKRPPGESPGYDSDSETESGQSTTKKPKHSGTDAEPDPTSLVFACPFFKLDAHKHRACANFVLRRVRDVKQHLNRKHHTPKFYCARCYDIFGNAKERDEHTRGVKCEYRENPHFEGITELQREQLMNTKERKSSPEEQWFTIWDILFPNDRRPRSVSRHSPQEEAVARLRDVWNTRHPELLAEVEQADMKLVIGHNDSTIHFLMDKLFDLLDAESSSPPQSGRKSSKQLAWGTSALDFKHTSQSGPLPREESLDELVL
ncbi:hypothetical protein PG999_014356 [Apiospora kogelbergensis]|uniref:C2H2-type domain-containing protein n=1 Tax=Apiospora kogelbergensis TaxID=1337665 RepID=A0AAW0Q4N8_9PEZI